MKKPILLFALFFVLAIQAFAQAQAKASDWVKLEPQAGRFSVLMPGPELPPEKTATTTSCTVAEACPYTTHLFTKRTDNGFFLVGWVDYAPNYRPNVQAEIAANRDNFVSGLKAKVTSEKQIKLGDNPGIEFFADKPDVVYRSRIYMVGQRPYMLIAGTYGGKDDSANVERFLSSFTLKK